MKKPPRCKAPMGPNLNRLLADQPQVPRLYRRKGGVWATHLSHVTVRWVGTHWVFTFLNSLAHRRFSLRTSSHGTLVEWLADYFQPRHPA
jgi:hypothetical protein